MTRTAISDGRRLDTLEAATQALSWIRDGGGELATKVIVGSGWQPSLRTEPCPADQTIIIQVGSSVFVMATGPNRAARLRL